MAVRRSLELVPPAHAAPAVLDQPARLVPGDLTPDARATLLLATWLSPAFPVGAFAFSHGVETAIADGRLRSTAAVEAWVEAVLLHGSGWNDAVLLAEAFRTTSSGDWRALAAVAELGGTMSPSSERHLEAASLGAAFLKAVAAGWPLAALDEALSVLPATAPYPVAVGLAAAAHRLPLEATLALYLNGLVANLVSVGVRLVPLGQTAGLKILAGLQPCILDMAARATASTLDDLGSGAMLSDIASMRHETLYSRVFRS